MSKISALALPVSVIAALVTASAGRAANLAPFTAPVPAPVSASAPAIGTGPAAASTATAGTTSAQAYPSAVPSPGISPVAETQSEAPLESAEELTKLRDPFQQIEIAGQRLVRKTDLEQYPIESFKLVAVLAGLAKYRAMVQAPDGKTFVVIEGVKIGNKDGLVKKITENSVKVSEKVINVLGKEEEIYTEIRFPNKNKLQKSAGSGLAGSINGSGA